MARSKRKDASLSTSRGHAKTATTKKRKQVSQDRSAFGEDPWTSMSGRSGAAALNRDTQSFTAVNKPKDTTVKPLRVRFTSPLGLGGQQDASKATPKPAPKPAPKAVDESVEDDITIPTPIHQTWEFKFETRDGRKGYCYQPISGFEHLFKASDISQVKSKSSGASGVSHVASQPHDAQAAVTPQGNGSTENAIDRHNSQRDPSPIRRPSNPGQADSAASSSSSIRKRTRTKAQGLLQAPSLPDKRPCLGGRSDEDEDDVKVVIDSSTTFLISDIDGLKNFFRHRLDELTMKPVRGMVTGWVKQLEPKRKGGYGPYHKMLPTEAPKDATPPWWPDTVLYVEPAHLEREALLTLAVDIALQHRDTRADELKRQQAWTSKLRQVAEAEVGLTDSEHFSSSKSPAFSTAMKKRAEKELLPSLFDVMQSYEDFVNQNRIWTYPDLTKAPAGKSITWRSIPRPPTQSKRFKRPRPAPQPVPASIVNMELDNDSGEETEVDDTMVRLMKKDSFKQFLRTIIQQDAEAARRRERAETARPMSLTPVAVGEDTVATQSMTMNQRSRSATPRSKSSEVEDVKPSVGVPFEHSMTQFRVEDHNTPVQMTGDHTRTPQSVTECATMPVRFQAPQTISFDQPAHEHDEIDMKGGSAMIPSYQTQVHRLSAPFLHSPGQYQTILSSVREEQIASGRLGRFAEDQHTAQQDSSPTLAGLSSAGSFTSLESSSSNSYEPPSFASYATHTFNNDFNDMTVFNQNYPAGQNQSFFSPPIAAQNIGYGCSPDLLYTFVGSSTTSLPSQVNQTFNGLPYDFAGGQN